MCGNRGRWGSWGKDKRKGEQGKRKVVKKQTGEQITVRRNREITEDKKRKKS